MKKVATMPTASRPSEPANGSVQLPVRSTTRPNTIGVKIPATAEPAFTSPLATPTCFGVMSIGTAQIGPIVISRKKNDRLMHAAITGNDFTTITGARNTSAPRNAPMITLRRAATTLRVRLSTRSLTRRPPYCRPRRTETRRPKTSPSFSGRDRGRA